MRRLFLLLVIPVAVWADGVPPCIVAPPAPEVFPTPACSWQAEGPTAFLSGDTAQLGLLLPDLSTLTGAIPLGSPPTGTFTSFFDVFTEVSIDGGPFVPGTGAVTIQGAGAPDTYFTQMTELNLSVGTALIRVDPITPSTGTTTITNLGAGGFQISSFFDVFTDLSLDGGTTWTPSSGQTVVELTESTPEPSTAWLLGGGILAAVGRRRLKVNR
jgi:hypothetical protein